MNRKLENKKCILPGANSAFNHTFKKKRKNGKKNVKCKRKYLIEKNIIQKKINKNLKLCLPLETVDNKWTSAGPPRSY